MVLTNEIAKTMQDFSQEEIIINIAHRVTTAKKKCRFKVPSRSQRARPDNPRLY